MSIDLNMVITKEGVRSTFTSRKSEEILRKLNISSYFFMNSTTCADGDYLMLRNGGNLQTSPFILLHPEQPSDQQNGRLCGLQLPPR